MTPVLEGNEVEKHFDSGAGVAIVDVDNKGKVLLSFSYNKEQDLGGFAKVSAKVEMKGETNFFEIAEHLAKKTETKFDDTVISGIKALLGMA